MKVAVVAHRKSRSEVGSTSCAAGVGAPDWYEVPKSSAPWTWWRRGGPSAAGLLGSVQRQVELEDVDRRLAHESEGA
ncbi:hypothetical protein, partial [Dactylosporangium fulvum]|uniref:hypothetical protein n=1 Tax=Dactylosporangium fulvum TaxID=53359 RepID=UPI0031D8D8E8